MGHLGPFFYRSNDAKRGEGGSPPASNTRWDPNHKWAHLSPILAPNPNDPKWTKGPQTQTGQEPQVIHFQPPETSDQLKKELLLNSGEDLSFINVPCTKGSSCGAYMV
ncbi:hypothetical protein O181_113532 [Austropuccinia psidii MF-1]|uniref:Uncharacterized protein n=1 Tax=Austropuccinia psidii MF-1 TaxID=1389203 RepID=A0A9Q3PVF8_9BASI|nr:hypothetical protein [Austropuccinia psidii MF-1]